MFLKCSFLLHKQFKNHFRTFVLIELFFNCSLFVLNTVKEPFKNIYSYCKLWNCSIFVLSLLKNILVLFKVLKQFFKMFWNLSRTPVSLSVLIKVFLKCSLFVLNTVQEPFKNICSYCKLWNCSIFVL